MPVPPEPVEANKPNLDLLLVEYEQCNAAYNNRDFMGEDEFAKIIQAFFVFLSLLLAVNVVTSSSEPLRLILNLILGAVGSMSFLSLTIDLEGTLGCRQVIRLRATEIERILSNYSSPRIWREMDLRNLKFEERLTKRKKDRTAPENEREGELYIWASRIFLIMWIVIVVSVSAIATSYSITLP